MGLFDIFRMGKVLVGTAKAVQGQRRKAQDIAALPMPEFISACLDGLNRSGGAWRGAMRPPSGQARALSAAKRLPTELGEFYTHCNGFMATEGDFPVLLPPLEELRLGADCVPALSEQLASTWEEYGNDTDKPGLLAVLPPDSLLAMVTNAAECHVRPSVLDAAVALCTPGPHDFSVILLTAASAQLPAGTVLDVESGSATRYPSFKPWLATRASLFG